MKFAGCTNGNWQKWTTIDSIVRIAPIIGLTMRIRNLGLEWVFRMKATSAGKLGFRS
ncbi:hypothetical protein Poly41_13220 [Novipirellula artificiosorum]|uniref:Uncharacterized protein n=1 Tax=Novipirellula artificiosorum TaxID=2528016 RepID=A0A5C6E019_9BACT|nr:hypothetical protein Poly41_13220 [Novipirellula artificiosorum]